MINMNRVVCCSVLFFSLTNADAGVLELMYAHKLKHPSLIHAQTTKEYSFKQLIDHQNPDLGTFTQRYFVDESYGKNPDAPVFLYICGEEKCTEDVFEGMVRSNAKKFHAKLIALEHRYYGESIPNNSLSTENLKYLTTHNALEDLNHFQTQMMKRKNWTGSWIAIGGSYPGSLAAYYRLKHPEQVVGAIASSAPVQSKEDFIEYDTTITEVVGKQCATNMQIAVSMIEDALNKPEQLDAFKTLFAASKVEDPVDFLSLVADVGSIAVQYGDNQGFCEQLASGATPLAGYAAAAKKLFKELRTTAVALTPQGIMSEKPSDYNSANDWLRQWYYQTCTEYGYEQNANPNPEQSTRSYRINTKYQHIVCHRLFHLAKPPNVDSMNATYYEPLLDPSVSNILFTNGENDPWSTLSLSKKNNNASNPNLNYSMISNAAHCEDLHTPSSKDSASMIKARQLTQKLLKQWLHNKG